MQGFCNRVWEHDSRGLVAEAMNHHPEWFNVWNKVVIDLNTHSVQGISNLDFELAAKIDEIFSA
jgi:4a-hydroxytetrahydrobiopterin dehydratase